MSPPVSSEAAGDESPCPMCGAPVPVHADVCAACGESFDQRPETGALQLVGAASTAWRLMRTEPVASIGANLAVFVLRGVYFMICYMLLVFFFLAGFGLVGGFNSGRELPVVAMFFLSLASLTVGAVIFLLGDQWFTLGQTAFNLQLVRAGSIDYQRLFTGMPRLLRAFVVQFLVMLACYLVWLGVLITTGELFREFLTEASPIWPLVIASLISGLVLVAILSVIWPYWWVLVEEDAPRLSAVRRAMELSAGHRFLSAALWLLVIGLNLLGGALFCIGLAFTIPFTQLLLTAAYAQLNPHPRDHAQPAIV